MYDLTVIIPTLDEETNIGDMVLAVDAILRIHSLNGQILVVDDNSTDGTEAAVKNIMQEKRNVSLLTRLQNPGLSQSVVDGFRYANSEVYVVMDADFSHPPSLIPAMYHEIKSGADIAIGSRYVAGGGISGWPLKRRILSAGATLIARSLFSGISDPVSGFFAVKKDVVGRAPLKPRGYKILFEILAKGKWMEAREVPYTFVNRGEGKSKLKTGVILDYSRQVLDICLYVLIHE